MIKITAKNTVKENEIEKFKSIAEKLICESQKEEGCIAYDLYVDISNPKILTFIEEWKNEEAIKLHNESIHFTSIVPLLGALVEEKEVNLYKSIK